MTESTLGVFRLNLRDLILAQFPITHIVTFEEARAIREIVDMAEFLDHDVTIWSTSRGLTNPAGEQSQPQNAADSDLAVAIAAFKKQVQSSENKSDGHLLILLDPYSYLNEKSANPIYRRTLRDLAIDIRVNGFRCTCFTISPELQIPLELEKEINILDFPLPSREEILSLIKKVVASIDKVPSVEVLHEEDFIESLADSALGLTYMEIEEVLKSSIVRDRKLSEEDLPRIFSQKQQIVRKSGVLEYLDTGQMSMKQIGGLLKLKLWLNMRSEAFSVEARRFGIKVPKGVLLSGIPGCGKSLSAKCVSAAWKIPLIRLDMGVIYSSLVGSSEERMREAIRTAEAVSPCVLWIDEIEKGLPSTGPHVGDSGVSLRVLSSFLTWMQEKTSPVFVFATANQLDLLPSELLRRGRFDEIFFVDLPSDAERKEINEIHLARSLQDPGAFDLEKLVEATGEAVLGPGNRYSGAEIENWINETLLRVFHEHKSDPKNQLEMTTSRLLETAKDIIPLSKMRSEDVAEMRTWASEHAISAS
ncbi:MAG: AAA family ATPase [Alphaproteobacteria bacterium]|jgi:SpoVK/Ycf46/Vps4 family AAA+-type ATPase|nr:AAA family ATPase [Alphaproteobacteria bacterium]